MQVEEKSQDCYNTSNMTANSFAECKLYPSVQQSLDNIIMKEGYISHNTFTRLISTDGGNYQGELYEVDVKGETSLGSKETNIFVKHIIPSEGVKDILSIDCSYINEVFIYTELRDVFNALQEAADIPGVERFKLAKSYDESNTDAILLDNLSRKGFNTLNRMDVIPLKFAELSIKQIAKFHGLSFVLKHKRKEYFEKKIKTIRSPLQFDEPWKDFVKRTFENSTKYFNSELQTKIDKFRYVLYEKQPKYLTGDTNAIRCLCHGDFRINNLLFKENNDYSTEVVLIDYQLLFYGSPVVDLLYFFFSSTDREFRKVHMKDLKSLYHETLTQFLKYFELDIEDVYPRKEFYKDFEESLDYGLMVGLYILPFCFSAGEETPGFCKDNIEDVTFKLDDRFRDRITEIVEEYLEWGIL